MFLFFSFSFWFKVFVIVNCNGSKANWKRAEMWMKLKYINIWCKKEQSLRSNSWMHKQTDIKLPKSTRHTISISYATLCLSTLLCFQYDHSVLPYRYKRLTTRIFINVRKFIGHKSYWNYVILVSTFAYVYFVVVLNFVIWVAICVQVIREKFL